MTTSFAESRGPGRPPKLLRRPSPQRQRQNERARAVEDGYVKDDLVLAAVKSGSPIEVLEQIRAATAVEAASLRWERMLRPLDPEAPKWSSRRVSLLAEVARLTLVIARLEPGRPPPATVAKIFDAFWSTVRDTSAQVLAAEETERLMAACAKRISAQDLEQIDDLFAGQAGRELVSVMLEAMTPSRTTE